MGFHVGTADCDGEGLEDVVYGGFDVVLIAGADGWSVGLWVFQNAADA